MSNPGPFRHVPSQDALSVLEGSWVALSGGISKITIVIARVRGLTTLRRTTHEPPSNKGTSEFELASHHPKP